MNRPPRDHLLRALVLGLLLTAWFGLIYGGANYLTGLRALRIRIHFDWELGLPFLPPAVLGYLSIIPLFGLSPFVLHSRREIEALAATLAAVIFAGGLSFLLVPAQAAYPAPPVLGRWSTLVGFARSCALQYNMLPSLHVALGVACVSSYSRDARARTKALLWSWSALLALSTLALHQHHVADVAAGLALGLAVERSIYRRFTRRPAPLSA
ncbi:MAG: hypothetical protein DMG07_22285 [Acidobacteria bacterium]|nr:MAG: hypothetical protein DMG07_22285 [Acidobacteriota bacterium]